MPKKVEIFFTHFQRKSARSEGATPLSGTPKKQDESVREGESEGGREGEREGGREREREREEHILSSDDEGPVAMVSRPRQRSLRKKRSCVLTNTLTSQQLVGHIHTHKYTHTHTHTHTNTRIHTHTPYRYTTYICT